MYICMYVRWLSTCSDMFQLENEIFVNGLASRRFENVSMGMEMFRVLRKDGNYGRVDALNVIPFSVLVRRDLFAPCFDRLRTFVRPDFTLSSSAQRWFHRERENLNKVLSEDVLKL